MNALSPIQNHQNLHSETLTREVLSGEVKAIQEWVNRTLEKMKEQEKILMRNKEVEKIVLLCEKSIHWGIIEFAQLLRETWDINIQGYFDWSLMGEVVYWEDMEILELLLKQENILINELAGGTEWFQKWLTALGIASRCEDMSILKRLLDDPHLDIYAHNQLVEAYKHANNEDVRDFLRQKLKFYGLTIPSLQ